MLRISETPLLGRFKKSEHRKYFHHLLKERIAKFPKSDQKPQHKIEYQISEKLGKSPKKSQQLLETRYLSLTLGTIRIFRTFRTLKNLCQNTLKL